MAREKVAALVLVVPAVQVVLVLAPAVLPVPLVMWVQWVRRALQAA